MEQSGMQGAGVWASLVSCMEKERAEILRKKESAGKIILRWMNLKDLWKWIKKTFLIFNYECTYQSGSAMICGEEKWRETLGFSDVDFDLRDSMR